tara:strand:+ start:1887 stop:2477 length:591 start_codon:yes stop_codon:yes gene_type:complete
MKYNESLNITGHLQIVKAYSDGVEEIVFDDHNIIVSGMSVGLSFLFSGSGSLNITDYLLDRFQVGVGTQAETSSVYELATPLSSVDNYGGVGANLNIVSAPQLKSGSVVTDQIFGLIPFSHVTRIDDSSVRYTLFLDEDAANAENYSNLALKEVGLYMSNPTGAAEDTAILVAYRNFSDIIKTDDFNLIFRWTINF